MLPRKIVVLDANAYWTEQLFSECGAFAEVLLLKPRDVRDHARRYRSFLSDRKPSVKGDAIYEQRFACPPGWMFGLWPMTQRRIARAIRKFTNDEPTVLVITYPQYRSLVALIRPALSVYYNCDDYRDNWPRFRQDVPEWESAAIHSVDVTICIAKYRADLLARQHPSKAHNIKHLPIGCTHSSMSGSFGHGFNYIPRDLAGLAKPLVGYIGALNYRFDFDLIAHVAEALPYVTFVLGGLVQMDGDRSWRSGLERAQRTPNVHFIGWVPHDQLGAYLNACDVLLMPYTTCNFNTNACPAKLWDYLGTGRPIVATNANPETLAFRDVIKCAGTPTAFAKEVMGALACSDESSAARRLAIAADHTWPQLASRLRGLLEAHVSHSVVTQEFHC